MKHLPYAGSERFASERLEQLVIVPKRVTVLLRFRYGSLYGGR